MFPVSSCNSQTPTPPLMQLHHRSIRCILHGEGGATFGPLSQGEHPLTRGVLLGQTCVSYFASICLSALYIQEVTAIDIQPLCALETPHPNLVPTVTWLLPLTVAARLCSMVRCIL